MKIQKINNNKIRVIFNLSEINADDVSTFINSPFKNKDLFYSILKTAKQKHSFDTKNHKLLIEAFTFMDNFIIYSITKLKFTSYSNNLTVRKKKNITKNNYIYKFTNSNDLLDFFSSLPTLSLLNFKKYTNNIFIYSYVSNYYFVIKNVSSTVFNPLLCEFATKIKNSDLNIIHLSEYGKLISKHNINNFIFNT